MWLLETMAVGLTIFAVYMGYDLYKIAKEMGEY